MQQVLTEILLYTVLSYLEKMVASMNQGSNVC